MKVKRVNHVGIAVESLDEALKLWREVLGLEPAEVEEVAAMRVRVAVLRPGETDIELLESTDDEGPIGKFISSKGPGIHHICLEVDDIEEALAELAAAGYKLIDEEPRVGAGGYHVAFVHPKSSGGVLLELSEKIK
ncbi:MAG: methylmalonyl-CoA epimerase [Candidatus Coatesbacteria bacterium]|nr:MAG: methylmalonyl-CoA epimerase [Candidatus Coatesbacteria bacterium]